MSSDIKIPKGENENDLKLTSLSKLEKRFLFTFDVFSIIYWITFAFILFYSLDPHIVSDGQSIFIFSILLYPAIPISVILLVITIFLSIKTFVKKERMNIMVWDNLFTVLLMPLVLPVVSIFIFGTIGFLYFYFIHTFTVYDKIFESSLIRGIIVIVILFLINRKRILRIFHLNNNVVGKNRKRRLFAVFK